jgi:hypothetical protein
VQTSRLLRPSGSVARSLSAPNFPNMSSRNVLINPAVDGIHREHRGALFSVRSHALITHGHEKKLTLQPFRSPPEFLVILLDVTLRFLLVFDEMRACQDQWLVAQLDQPFRHHGIQSLDNRDDGQ